MRRKGLTSARLHWMVDYACRDDYGATAENVSAWSGLFYFAARKRKAHGDSQPFMAWPEGNGRIVRHFAERLRSSGKDWLRLGLAVSGGSDCHGPDPAHRRVGSHAITSAELAALRERAGCAAR